MSTIEKLIRRMLQKPVPKDMTIDEIERIAAFYGCSIITGGNHQIRIRCNNPKRTIPIPIHGNTIKPAYIKELIELFEEIEKGKGENE